MKYLFSVITFIIVFGCQSTKNEPISRIFYSDIDLFWEAFDKVVSTKDSALQVNYLQNMFFDKASIGQKSMFRARNYTVEEYQNAINNYPKFWSSARGNTDLAKTMSHQLQEGISKLEKIYPNLRPAAIYFTIGALRSNGTTTDSLLLIGSELALANSNTVIDELPDNFSHLHDYFKSEPSKNLVFLNIHEYVHTQQLVTTGENLLAQTVLEGVAEFIAEKALQVESPNPQIAFGKENDAKIKAAFEEEMFSTNFSNWIWNSPNNDFGMRDLAYYVGYRICQSYYSKAERKSDAIAQMIELDYNDEKSLKDFVEKSGYFSESLSVYKRAFEQSRPTILNLDGIGEERNNVSLDSDILTLTFSEEMDTRYRNFELGPLGEEAVIRMKEFIGFSDDGKTLSFRIEKLEANKNYQLEIGSGFRNLSGIPLVPYLIDFKTE